MEKDEINMKEIFNMNREQQKQMFKNIINDVEIKRKIQPVNQQAIANI